MKETYRIIFFVALAIQLSFSQVGIGTDSPTTTLDVNGTVRISSIPPATASEITSFTGLTSANAFNKSTLGANLIINFNGELITSPVSRKINSFNLAAVTPDTYSGGNPIIYDLDLQIQEDEVNEYTTFINFSNFSQTFLIAGIANGTHGRKITLFNDSTAAIRILEGSASSYSTDVKNEIITLTSSQLVVNSKGIVELVYDQFALGTGPNDGRWLVIKYRN